MRILLRVVCKLFDRASKLLITGKALLRAADNSPPEIRAPSFMRFSDAVPRSKAATSFSGDFASKALIKTCEAFPEFTVTLFSASANLPEERLILCISTFAFAKSLKSMRGLTSVRDTVLRSCFTSLIAFFALEFSPCRRILKSKFLAIMFKSFNLIFGCLNGLAHH